MDILFKFTSRNQITDRWLQDNPDVIIECWGCGKPIQKDDPRRKFCTRNCYKKYWRATKKVPIYKYCDWCGDEFIAKRSDTIYDDINCARAASRKRRGIPVLSETPIECNWCGIKFTRNHVAQKYCRFQCFFANRCYQKRLYHVRTRGAFRKSIYDDLQIPKNKIEVSKAEVQAFVESRRNIDMSDTKFDKDAWNARAKEAEKRIAARFA